MADNRWAARRFVYRSLEHLERVIAEAQAGRYELDYSQQPSFGFFSATYLGEIAVCVSLFDPVPGELLIRDTTPCDFRFC